jgi:hypothetical protein
VIVIVGGQRRKVGKTAAVCDIIEATRGARWTAIKITSHSHGADLSEPLLENQTSATPANDTGRYLLAGAQQSVWIRCTPDEIQAALAPFLTGNVIIESNSAAGAVAADLLLFVVEGGESKPSAEAIRARDHIVIYGRASEEAQEQVRRQLSEPTASHPQGSQNRPRE